MTEKGQNDNKNISEKNKVLESIKKPQKQTREQESLMILQNYHQRLELQQNSGLPVTHNQVSEELMKIEQYKTMEDTDDVYIYRNGIYEKNGELEIKKSVQIALKNDVSKHFTSEVIGDIQRSTYTKRDLFDSYPDLRIVENGILNLETRELSSHSPDYLCLKKMPIFYDPEARATEILKFIDKVVSPRDVEKLKEFFGYLLENGYPIHRVFMLHGDTDRGKTTFTKLVEAFIGEENISTESLQDLQGHFSMAQLYGKIANISDDLSNIEIKSAGNFKRLCGESLCRAEEKFKKPFSFTNTAKGLFTTNEMPRTRDKTDAFYNRWELVPFITQFFKNAEPRKIPGYIKQLITKPELSGLLNIAIEKLHELRINGEFTNANTPEQNREQWELLSDPILKFISEYCQEEQNAWIPRDDFYLKLSKYLDENRSPTISSNKVTRTMKEKYALVRKGSVGHRKRGWLGLKWLESEEGLKQYDNS